MKEAICTIIMKLSVLLASKNELCATKVKGFQYKLLQQRAPS